MEIAEPGTALLSLLWVVTVIAVTMWGAGTLWRGIARLVRRRRQRH